MIDVAAALILSRFREGDANVLAVRLFSRNDALAKVAILFGAFLVAWAATPDLI